MLQNIITRFKSENSLDIRINKFKQKQLKYPNKILILMFEELKHYIVIADPQQLLINFKNELFKKNSNKTTNILLFINEQIPKGDQTLENLYQLYKDQDGFLYMKAIEQDTFG